MPEQTAPVYCPACDKEFPNMTALKIHLELGRADGDPIHQDVYDLEGWGETPLETT